MRGAGSLPEEGMVLHTHLPQLLGCLVIGQLETDGALVLLRLTGNTCRIAFTHGWFQEQQRGSEKPGHLRWSYFDEETAAFVGNLENFGPGKAVDPQLLFINHETTGTHPQRDFNTVQILKETVLHDPSTEAGLLLTTYKSQSVQQKARRAAHPRGCRASEHRTGASCSPLLGGGPPHTWKASWHSPETSCLLGPGSSTFQQRHKKVRYSNNVVTVIRASASPTHSKSNCFTSLEASQTG